MKTKISSLWTELEIEDEIGLLSQIYDGLENPTSTIQIIHNDSKQTQVFIESREDIYSIKKIETLNKFVEFGALIILNESDKEFKKIGIHYHQYDVLLSWPKLHEIAGYYHDFEAKESYGAVQQEKIIRKIILEKSLKTGSNKLSLSEKYLGKFIVEPIDDEHSSFNKSPDLHIKFMTCLFELERQGFIKISGLDFDFDAPGKFIENISSDYNDDNFIYYDYYYPASHCHVEIEIVSSEYKNIGNKQKQAEPDNIIPAKIKGWSLRKDIKEAHLIYKDEIKFTFKHNDSIEYRCFEYLFKRISEKISYEDLYKYGFRLKYPVKGKRAIINKSVITVSSRMIKKLQTFGLKQFHLTVNMGLTLSIKK